MPLNNVKLSVPTFDDKLPSTGKPIRMRAFRVADEKTLLIAGDSNNAKQMADALKDVISNCVEGVDVNQIAPYDIEYLFLKLRSISVGEISKVGVPCSSCTTMNEIDVDISTIEVKKFKEHTDVIKIEDNLAFKMKHPDPANLVDLDLDNPLSIIEVIVNSVKEIYTEDEQIEIDPGDLVDLRNLIESMSTSQFEKLKAFFETMPRVRKEITFVCGACGADNQRNLEGIANFF